jgi:hypothetical protein
MCEWSLRTFCLRTSLRRQGCLFISHQPACLPLVLPCFRPPCALPSALKSCLACLLPGKPPVNRHGEAMAALSGTLTAKWLNTEGRQRLRSCWDRTRWVAGWLAGRQSRVCRSWVG